MTQRLCRGNKAVDCSLPNAANSLNTYPQQGHHSQINSLQKGMINLLAHQRLPQHLPET